MSLKVNGNPYSATVSIFLQSLKHDTSPEPRMLSESEQTCLRQQKLESRDYIRRKLKGDAAVV